MLESLMQRKRRIWKLVNYVTCSEIHDFCDLVFLTTMFIAFPCLFCVYFLPSPPILPMYQSPPIIVPGPLYDVAQLWRQYAALICIWWKHHQSSLWSIQSTVRSVAWEKKIIYNIKALTALLFPLSPTWDWDCLWALDSSRYIYAHCAHTRLSLQDIH